MIRDLLSGSVLVAEHLKSRATGDIERRLEQVIALPSPMLGVRSDTQDAMVAAIRNQLPGVPHQICQYHDLTDMAAPVVEADRTLQKELKKKVRGIRQVERAVAGKQAEAEVTGEQEVIAGYCVAIQTSMPDDGK